MKVQNFEHKNQFVITDRGNIFFQSYKSLIAKIDNMVPDNDCIENDQLFDEYLKKWDEGFYHD